VQHPTEISGLATEDRELADIDPDSLSGLLVCLPIDNPLQMRLPEAQFRRCWKRPATNLNRQWPGDPKSRNPLSRLAAAVWEQVVRRADAVIDYHCCRSVDPRFAACRADHKPSEALAAAMGLEAIDLQTADSYAQGPLIFPAAEQLDMPAVLVESHPAHFQVREAVAACAASLMRAMVHLGMLTAWQPERRQPAPTAVFRRSDRSFVLTAAHEGYLGPRKWAGEAAHRGEALAVIRSLETFAVLQTLRAPTAGAVGCVGTCDRDAIVSKGAVVATLKRVKYVS
jgi:predicted deacylase